MEERYQAIIVGGGPVGVALAVELGQRGVSCALVERNLAPQRIPKGQNLTQRTLEHFYFWQCVDQLRAARVMPKGYPIGGVTAYGSLMGEYWYTPPGRETVRPYFFQDNERLPQYLTEGVLRTRLAAIPAVRTYFGWVADSFEQDEGSVRVAIAEDGGSGQRVLAADYLVGCDGARSMVREQLGIGRSGPDFQEKMVLALFRSRSLHEALQRFPDRTTYRVLHPDLKGAWMFFGRVDVGEGWFFHAPVPQDATPDNYDYHGLVQRAAGVAFAAEFDHIGYWDLRVAAADRYRQGRAFIAGDACHTHPPLWGVRPKHRPGGRGESGLEADRRTGRLGRRGAAGLLHPGAAADSCGDRARRHRRRDRVGPGVSGALPSGPGPGGLRAGVEAAGDG